MIHRHFQKHDKIWDAGDDASFNAIVVSGAVKLIKLMPDGRQQIIGMHFAPDFIGDPFSQKRKSFAEAATDTELCCFPTREFVRALQKDHEIEHALLEETFQDLTQARDWMLTLGRKSAPEKIATFLVSMMERAENLTCQNLRPLSVNVVLELPLSRAEIADYLGLTLETVSRHFTRLRKQGIVRLLQSNIIEILKASELRRLAGDWDGDEK